MSHGTGRDWLDVTACGQANCIIWMVESRHTFVSASLCTFSCSASCSFLFYLLLHIAS